MEPKLDADNVLKEETARETDDLGPAGEALPEVNDLDPFWN